MAVPALQLRRIDEPTIPARRPPGPAGLRSMGSGQRIDGRHQRAHLDNADLSRRRGHHPAVGHQLARQCHRSAPTAIFLHRGLTGALRKGRPRPFPVGRDRIEIGILPTRRNLRLHHRVAIMPGERQHEGCRIGRQLHGPTGI